MLSPSLGHHWPHNKVSLDVYDYIILISPRDTTTSTLATVTVILSNTLMRRAAPAHFSPAAEAYMKPR